jgi:gliding motility-associated-like protein
MKLKIYFAIAAIASFSFTKAQTVNITSGCAPLSVTFTPPSGSTTDYWDFDDGGATSSTPPNPLNYTPQHNYTTPRIYHPVYKNSQNGAVIHTFTITIYALPTIQITTVPNPAKGCSPLTVTLTANVSPIPGVSVIGYSWAFGDNTPGSGVTTSHTYTSSNSSTFDVSVSIQTNPSSCQTQTVVPGLVSCSAPPVASFLPTPSSGCVTPLNVNFTNYSGSSSPPLTYAWNLNDGSPIITTQTLPQQTYTTTGNHTVQLKVKDSNGCADSTTQTISIGGPPVTSFTAADTVCINLATTFTNTSTSGTYQWVFDAGTSIPSSSATNPTVSFLTAGTHTVSLTTSSSGCPSSSITKTIYVEAPVATFTSTPTYSCSQPAAFLFTGSSNSHNVASWSWVLADGTKKTVQSFSHNYFIKEPRFSTYFEQGILTTFPTSLTITTSNGCISPPVSSNDSIDLPWARFMPDTTQGCAPLKVTFSDSSHSREKIVKWEWNFGDGIPNTIINSPNSPPTTHTFTAVGTYSVSLIITNSKGCVDTSYYAVIHVGSAKNFDFVANPTSVCPGVPVNLSLSSTTDTTGVTAWHYSSNYGETLNGQPQSQCFNNSNASVVFKDTIGTQAITLTADYNGCLTPVTHSITVKGPIAHFDYLTNCVTPFTMQFTDQSEGATSVNWDFNGDGVTDSVTTTAGITFKHSYPAVSKDYAVIITAIGSSGCPNSKDTAVIHIRNLQPKIISSTSLCAGINYTFDGSSSIDVFANCYQGYSWIFSDTSKRPVTSQSPTGSFAFTPGLQTVGLVVQDINGCHDTALQRIKVYGIKAQYIISDNSICFPAAPITFTDQSQSVSDTTIASWKWSFGDNTPNSTSASPPPHTYTQGSNTAYTTSLRVIDKLGCKDSTTLTITTYTPTSTISISPSPNICLGTPITANASPYGSSGNLSFTWNLGDSTPVTTGSSVPHTYTLAATYTVNLSFTETSSGCSGVAKATVNVQSKPYASYTADKTNPICYNNSIVTFTSNSTRTSINSPITSTNWYIGSGSAIPGTAITPPALAKGYYPIKLVVSTQNGCMKDTTITWSVIEPTGTFTVTTNTTICKGDSVRFKINSDTSQVQSYKWDFGDGQTQLDTSPVYHTYNNLPPQGFTTAKLVLYGGGSCNKTIDTIIYIHYVKSSFSINSGSDSATCLGKADTLKNNSSQYANSFVWDFGDGTYSTDSTKTIYHTYTASNVYPTPKTYEIKLTASNKTYGCPDDTTENVTIYPLPILSAVGDTICKNNRAYLSATNNSSYNYLWTPKNELNKYTVYNPNLTGSESETFTVTVSDPNKCVSSATAFLYVVPPLTAPTSFDTSIVIGDTIKLPIAKQNNMEHFTWTPETGLSCTDCPYPQVHPLEDITYNVLMKDSCTQVEETFTIHIKPEVFIQLPTTFTPNGDGTNDIIYVKGWGIKDLISFEIYNRWGELVFTTSDLNEGWNGNYKGMLQNNDTYVWKVKALSWRNTTLAKEGHFNLMR